MKYSKKSRLIILFSGILLGGVILGALFLGAGVGVGKGVGKDTPPNLYISAEEEKTKVALRGTYNWSYRGKHIHADSDHPVNFEYNPDNIVSVTSQQQLIISTQKLKADKKYYFTLEQNFVYKDGQLVEPETVEPSYMNGDLYLQAPAEAGEYIYVLSLNFKDKGTVNYGFVVRVDDLLQDVLIEKTTSSVVTPHEIVNFADGQVEIAGGKLNYNAEDLGSLYDKIGAARVEQMMYRAVVFYKAAFIHDFDTVNRLANKKLKDELKRWADNTLQKGDSSAMPIMKLDNYTDVDFPIGISAPRLHPVDSDRYMVMLEISEKMKVRIYFEVPEKGEPLVEGFSFK